MHVSLMWSSAPLVRRDGWSVEMLAAPWPLRMLELSTTSSRPMSDTAPSTRALLQLSQYTEPITFQSNGMSWQTRFGLVCSDSV